MVASFIIFNVFLKMLLFSVFFFFLFLSQLLSGGEGALARRVGFCERSAAETGAAWPYDQPAWVFTSRQLPTIEGADIRFVQGDVYAVHTQMRAVAGHKNIWIVGGGDLAGQFYDAQLLDEMIVQVGSVTLGKGKPVFPRQALCPSLRLASVRQLGIGIVMRLPLAIPPPAEYVLCQ